MENKGKSLMLPLLAIAAVGLSGYAIYESQKSKNYDLPPGSPDAGNKNPPSSPSPPPKKQEAAAFPLSIGLKDSQYVRDVQRALLAKGGSAAKYISDTGGADGNFGNGLANALKAAGYAATISKTDYERILKEAKQSPEGALSTGKTLQEALDKAKYFELGAMSTMSEAMAVLAMIASIDDYKRLSSAIQASSWGRGRSLATLITEKYYVAGRPAIEARLKAIGLAKNPSGLWMLPSPGLGALAMAVDSGEGYADDGTVIRFPARSIAGRHLRTRNGMAYIENSGRIYAVPSRLIARIPE